VAALSGRALFVGVFTALNLTGPPEAQWVEFALASVVLLLVFRRRILRMMQSSQPDPGALVGEIASTLGAIKPGEIGRAELRGSVWSAKNASPAELPRGARCRVQSVDGLTLVLAPELKDPHEFRIFVFFAFAVLVLIIIAKTAVVVPQQNAYIVRRVGRYAATMQAGFLHPDPFVDVIRYRHTLKEQSLDIPAQICITRDNVQVQVDGVLYLKVLNPERASYGISDYMFAITQLCQTNLSSEVGRSISTRHSRSGRPSTPPSSASSTRRPSPGA
jgi:membrane protein implicated in regulation of membrane protease activity